MERARRYAWTTSSSTAIVAVGGGISGYSQGGVGAAVGGVVGAALGLVGGMWWAREDQRRSSLGFAREKRARALESFPSDRVQNAVAAVPSRSLLAEWMASRGRPRFWGRQAELQMLKEWATDPHSPAVCLLTGPALVGKTRLSIELCQSLPRPWQSGRLKFDQAAEFVDAARRCGEPMMVIVEVVGPERELVRFLADLAVDHRLEVGPPIKALLVSRKGSWRRLVMGMLPITDNPILDGAAHISLAPVGSGEDLLRWYRDAIRAFTPTDEAPVEPVHGPPEGTTFGELMAEAYVFAGADHSGIASSARVLMDRGLSLALAEHERRQWPVPSEAEIPWRLRERVVASLLLHSPTGPEEAVDTLRRLPELADASRERLFALAAWARHVYPGNGGRDAQNAVAAWLARPKLGLLNEGLIAPIVNDSSAWQALTRDLDTYRASRVLDLLMECPHEQAWALVESMLQQGPWTPTVILAISTSWRTLAASAPASRLDRLVALFIAQGVPTREDIDALRDLASAEPSMTQCRLALADRDVNEWRTKNDAIRLAVALNARANARRDLGAYDEALADGREAEALVRDQIDGPAIEVLHVGLLQNLAASLSELGQRDEALFKDLEAEKIIGRIAKSDPIAYGEWHAQTLFNLSNGLGEAGRSAEALDAAERAQDKFAAFAEAHARRYLLLHAMSLGQLGARLSDSGRLSEAKAALRHADSIFTDLAAQEPHVIDSERPDNVDPVSESLAVLQLREGTLRRFSSHQFGTSSSSHGAVLATLAHVLRESGMIEDAVVAARRAVELTGQRSSEPGYIDAHARALGVLSACLSQAGQKGEAVEASFGVGEELRRARPFPP